MNASSASSMASSNAGSRAQASSPISTVSGWRVRKPASTAASQASSASVTMSKDEVLRRRSTVWSVRKRGMISSRAAVARSDPRNARSSEVKSEADMRGTEGVGSRGG